LFFSFYLADAFPSEQMSDQSHSDTSSDTTSSESDDTEDNNCNISTSDSNITAQNNQTDITRPPIITKSIVGVRFMNSQELSFVDKQRVQFRNQVNNGLLNIVPG
jgi:hypothetical protein